MQKDLSKVISMLVDMETQDGLKRGAIMVITKSWLGTCRPTLPKNQFLLCTPTVLVYNSELGIINSSEFFGTKKLQQKGYVLPSIYILFFSKVWWEVTT